MTILVTGGLGYIGSHTCVSLIRAGHRVVIIDNLSNSSLYVLDRIRELTGVTPELIQGDVRNIQPVAQAFHEHNIEAVIHFAGLKVAGESVENPMKYYSENLYGAINLLETMRDFNVKRLVFSSSAAVYAETPESPLAETADLGPIHAYGRTKLMIEDMLRDLAASDSTWRIAMLRYFNPIGAHPSGKLGEYSKFKPTNVAPMIIGTLTGEYKIFTVYGNNFPTSDGTGVRDYIHVVDLAHGHVAALNWLEANIGAEVFNLGTGHGTSVMELIQAFSDVSGQEVEYFTSHRRPGDMAEVYADPSKAMHELGWQSNYDLIDMCRDAWKWTVRNPNGYTPVSLDKEY